jgi:hypothetical protein
VAVIQLQIFLSRAAGDATAPPDIQVLHSDSFLLRDACFFNIRTAQLYKFAELPGAFNPPCWFIQPNPTNMYKFFIHVAIFTKKLMDLTVELEKLI